MDNNSRSVDNFAPQRPAAIAFIVGGVALLAVGTVFHLELAGRVMIWIAALMVLGYGVAGLWIVPRLAVENSTIHVRTMRGTRRYDLDTIGRIRVSQYRRLGRMNKLLEIEGSDESLTIMTRWDLGTDPLDVAEVLQSAGFHVEQASRR